VPELVVLAFEQMMQRQHLRGPIRTRTIGLDPARDNVGTAGDTFSSADAGASLRFG